MPATTAAMTKAMTALLPIAATAVPDREKIPAAIIVPRPMANAILNPSVRVCSTIACLSDAAMKKSPPIRRTSGLPVGVRQQYEHRDDLQATDPHQEHHEQLRRGREGQVGVHR